MPRCRGYQMKASIKFKAKKRPSLKSFPVPKHLTRAPFPSPAPQQKLRGHQIPSQMETIPVCPTVRTPGGTAVHLLPFPMPFLSSVSAQLAFAIASSSPPSALGGQGAPWQVTFSRQDLKMITFCLAVFLS